MAMKYQKGTVYLRGQKVKMWYGKYTVYLRNEGGKEVGKRGTPIVKQFPKRLWTERSGTARSVVQTSLTPKVPDSIDMKANDLYSVVL